VTDDQGWHSLSATSHLLRYLLAILMLAPITLLMGGTLTLLVRFLVGSDLPRAGYWVGVLYAANTAGASIGCFAVDSALIPALGISGAQGFAVALNVFAAAGAIALIRRAPASAPPPIDEGPDAESPDAVSRAVIFAVALSGAAGMGLEIVWFRYLSSVMEGTRATFSLILTIMLVGTWIGSALAGVLSKRTRRPVALYALFQLGLGATALFSLAVHDPSAVDERALRQAWIAAGALGRDWLELWYLLRTVLLVVGLPAVFLGSAFPLANAILQRRASTVGRRAGSLYLFNTLGGVAGSLGAGFVLLPLIGMQAAVLAMAVLSALVVVLLIVPAREEARAPRVVAAAAAAAFVFSGLWLLLPGDALLKKVYDRPDVRDFAILFKEGVTESIAITERPRNDDRPPERILYVDGVLMSGTIDGAQRYMRAFVHLPLLMQSSPRRVLVICFGVGNTLHAASLHKDVEALEIADLSRQILDHGNYFERWNERVLEDPRTRVFVNDGRQHLRMQAEDSYDLVTLEPPPIARAGVSALYSKEFYALARSRLKEGGFLTQWLPAYQVGGDVTPPMVRAFLDVFPDAVMLSGYERHLILVGRNGGSNTIDPEVIVRELAARPEVQADLARYNLGTPLQIVGTFVANAARLEQATRDAPALTDDWPIQEYAVEARPVADSVIPASLFDTSGVKSWCPRCFDATGALVAPVEDLDVYLEILGAWYQSENFRVFSPVRPRPPMVWGLKGDPARLDRVFAEQPYLQAIVR
jgi:predicted membrane-bound spermidine synthase